MIISRSIPELRKQIDDWKRQGFRIGLVPTMGYLHKGHLSLVDQIKPNCDRVIASIFINPKQFGPGEDMDRYPRDFENDQRLLEQRGADVIFYPESLEMYPEGFLTYIQVEELSQVLCGRSRPTHFRGVTTVVAKLFLITECDVAAFGQKDYQQALIIQRMVEDLNFNIKILICPTVRESDGLAMSSRNSYLTKEEREKAVCLIQALEKAMALHEFGEVHAARLREEMVKTVSTFPEVRADYLEVVDALTLQPVEKVDRKTLLAGAVWLGKARLIDNVLLEPK